LLQSGTTLSHRPQDSDDPAGAAIRLALLEQDPDLTVDHLRSISSRNGVTALAVSDVRDYFTKSERGTISEKSRKGVFWENGDDFSIARAQPSVQGSDATGYKVTLWPLSNYKESVYVVRMPAKRAVRFRILFLELGSDRNSFVVLPEAIITVDERRNHLRLPESKSLVPQ